MRSRKTLPPIYCLNNSPNEIGFRRIDRIASYCKLTRFVAKSEINWIDSPACGEVFVMWEMGMKKSFAVSCLTLYAFFCTLTGSALSATYPFEGTWDCEVQIFRFSSTTYNNGSENLRYKNVRKVQNGFLITFGDGYRIGLFNIKPFAMTWFSPASGDDFVCKRLRK